MSSSEIRTFTGKMIDPLHPKIELIDIHDIAHALSNLCRYTGHTPKHYSVAQHSVYVSYNCKHPLMGLLHDGSEAYMNDLAGPVKHHWLLWGYRRAEGRMQKAIYEKYLGKGVIETADVKAADIAVREVEQNVMFKQHYEFNPSLKYFDKPLNEMFACWTAEKAEHEFMKRFINLETHLHWRD